MKPKIVFLHTVQSNQSRFDKLAKEQELNIEIEHVVNEQLLSDAINNGAVNSNLFELELLKIRLMEPAQIICTCSTYGELCDNYNDVQRIDEPAAEYLVANYKKVLLVYAAESTKRVSENLLLRKANEQFKNIEIIACDCTNAWGFFLNNDLTRYKEHIAQNIKKHTLQVDAIFLSQASMQGVEDLLDLDDKEVLTSPEIGVQSILNKLLK